MAPPHVSFAKAYATALHSSSVARAIIKSVGVAIPFAVPMLSALYGPQSAQLQGLNHRIDQCTKPVGFLNVDDQRLQQAYSAIQTAVIEVENGLVGNLRAQVAGEVFAELVGLGKDILQDGSGAAKNVSAVLIAAAFEDIIRRIGAELAGVSGRPKLEDVIKALKDKDVLKGGEPTTAQSYLRFRNDSLHADWTKVQTSQIHSCIAFIEALLVNHFN